ncbi:polysaccharide pyruvyl transferase family protein [Thiohalomonas denitrificans]|uniref:Succinoglycan biosynthesis protein ExoV n=1 Tax=Thiohalomonas denitrificans TaxID=415747 RepID=A0A1G5Q2Y4_9GAMM|nr:polysaccharide pyruvyl transferase family protein [Thiohalomonas denitrificans]SCZ55906.1 succinoglycan biosynthesis protein ExoV [Thiohalomonas denitrificans]
MRLHYFKCPDGSSNFGDELNPWLWQRRIPELLSDDDQDLFLGIGTILNRSLASGSKKLVFGSGCGYHHPPRLDDHWDIRFLRGPLSARVLGLSNERVVTDAAILLRPLLPPAPLSRSGYGFMPHWQNAHADWARLCDEHGLVYIDPADPVDAVLRKLNSLTLLLSEAMHGAIVADLLRVPWIPITTNSNVLPFKWRDWCLSLGLDYYPSAIPSLWAPSASSRDSSLRKHYLRAKRRWVAKQLFSVIEKRRPLLSDSKRLADRAREAELHLAQLRSEFMAR